MVLTKLRTRDSEQQKSIDITTSKKRRDRRKKLKAARAGTKCQSKQSSPETFVKEQSSELHTYNVPIPNNQKVNTPSENTVGYAPVDPSICSLKVDSKLQLTMSSKGVEASREDVLAAREAKRLAKQKAKSKCGTITKTDGPAKVPQKTKDDVKEHIPCKIQKQKVQSSHLNENITCARGKDETDQVVKETDVIVKNRNETKNKIQEESAKQAKKQGAVESDSIADTNMTVKDVVTTLKDIVNVAKNMEVVTAKVQAINLKAKRQPEESGKSKAEVRAERRAKQENQRAAKHSARAVNQDPSANEQVATKEPPEKPATKKPLEKPADKAPKQGSKEAVIKEKSPKSNSVGKKQKSQSGHRANWFQHLYPEHDKEALKKVALNSNLHPAIIKLGVQLSSRAVTGSNARCIALLDALKQMVRDFVVPARAEFARGLEAQLAASAAHLWARRAPAATQTNALNYLRHRLQQLPNDVDEFDAKKRLQEEMERYVREQIETAGEAISLTVRRKIAPGDRVLTYGCSSLIERILREAWASGVQFHTVVVGNRVQRGGREMLRRLAACGLPCTYLDITALGHVMHTVNKVVVGASALLANGWVVGAVGTAQVALAARARNVPVLVAAETHKFCGRVQTDAFVHNELGDPDDLIDKSDENSPLKSWRSNPLLTPLNLTYDVTPPRLVTAVVTELAMLPCTSAPVVLRFKLAEYSI